MFMQTLKYLLFGTHYIVLDTPLLFESGYHKFLGTVIVVWWYVSYAKHSG